MKKSQDLNISYNLGYNKSITFHPHFVKRWKTREVDIKKVEETVRTGRVFEREGRKLGLKRYFKENKTYYVVCIVEEDFIEVITAWKKKGR